jgi:hypothetical protein
MLNNGKKAVLVGKASVILIHIHSTSGDKLLSACIENVLAILSNAEITWSWGFHRTMGMEGEKWKRKKCISGGLPPACHRPSFCTVCYLVPLPTSFLPELSGVDYVPRFILVVWFFLSMCIEKLSFEVGNNEVKEEGVVYVLAGRFERWTGFDICGGCAGQCGTSFLWVGLDGGDFGW